MNDFAAIGFKVIRDKVKFAVFNPCIGSVDDNPFRAMQLGTEPFPHSKGEMVFHSIFAIKLNTEWLHISALRPGGDTDLLLERHRDRVETRPHFDCAGVACGESSRQIVEMLAQLAIDIRRHSCPSRDDASFPAVGIIFSIDTRSSSVKSAATRYRSRSAQALVNWCA